MIHLTNGPHSATLHPLGATVLSWRHHGIEQLFVSPAARFVPGTAIRGGIPVCWPWFSREHPGPSHGIARTRPWTAIETSESHAILSLRDDDSSRSEWPHRFELTLEVRVSDGLVLTLTHHNLDDGPVRVWGAFHNYFRVPDPTRVRIHGLDGAPMFDKLTGESTRHCGLLEVHPPIDAVFTQRSATLDADRQVRIEGPEQIVVWNPGDAASAIDDLGSPEGFICVEAARTTGYATTLDAGESNTFSMRLSVVSPRGPR